MKKKGPIILGVLAALFVGAHFMPAPPADNPPVEEIVPAPQEVLAVLKGSCWDCHSNETVWPWYSHVVPGKWLVRDHVEHGRRHVNFTTWNRYSVADQADAFEEIAEVLEEGEMPLQSYLILHGAAELTAEERDILLRWAHSMEGRPGVREVPR